MLHLNFVVLDDYGKKMETVMINNSTNINKMDLTFSHLRSLNTKKQQHILIETQVLALGQAQQIVGVKLVNEIPTYPFL